ELFELCSDLVVIARGRLSPRIAARDATPALIGQWMSGLFRASAADPGPVAAAIEVEAHA
ncbi:MAG TPA: ABC transporter ATP-binding protein, partial [Polyangia bacterium]|nr:ABC transporter ATP-binding protein [Polyangia bacterium]